MSANKISFIVLKFYQRNDHSTIIDLKYVVGGLKSCWNWKTPNDDVIRIDYPKNHSPSWPSTSPLLPGSRLVFGVSLWVRDNNISINNTTSYHWSPAHNGPNGSVERRVGVGCSQHEAARMKVKGSRGDSPSKLSRRLDHRTF